MWLIPCSIPSIGDAAGWCTAGNPCIRVGRVGSGGLHWFWQKKGPKSLPQKINQSQNRGCCWVVFRTAMWPLLILAEKKGSKSLAKVSIEAKMSRIYFQSINVLIAWLHQFWFNSFSYEFDSVFSSLKCCCLHWKYLHKNEYINSFSSIKFEDSWNYGRTKYLPTRFKNHFVGPTT